MTISYRPLPAPLPDLDRLPPATSRRVVADAPHSYPCRRCLRDAEPGEALVLLSYDPFLGDSPYRQAGPILVHADDCAPYPEDLTRAPEQLSRRQLSVRGFDAEHAQVATAVVDGAELDAVAERLLADPDLAYLHVHNAAPGCFAVRVDRTAPTR